MKKYLIIAFLAITLFYHFKVSSQNHDPFYQTIVDKVSYDSLFLNLQEFEALGVKEVGNSELDDTRDWILSKYSALGYTNIKVDTFSSWGNDLYNIIVTKTGTLFPDTFVIIDGHYDTNNGTGTNDNGTGTSIILECARVLKDVNTEYSVKFIHFSGEEMGYLGSEHYVNDIVNSQNMKIRIVLNIDEVGGVAGLPNDTLKCESDQSNPSSNNAASDAFTDTLMTLTEMYSSLKTIKTNAYGSDYVPFQQNGEIITGYYEYNKSNYVHTSSDFLSHLDTSYVFEIAKASVASTMYFARAYDISVDNAEHKTNAEICIFPNPFSDNITVSCENCNKELSIFIFNEIGQIILEKDFLKQQLIDLSFLHPSLYFFIIYDEKGEMKVSGKISKN